MNRSLLSVSVVALALAVSVGQNSAQQRTPTPNQRTTQSGETLTADAFVQKVWEGNHKEVEMAKLAASRAKSADVKSFAQQLVTDHTSSSNALEQYAAKHNVTLQNPAPKASTALRDTKEKEPEALAATDDAHMKNLTSKNGAEFDQAFIDMMVENHQNGVALFERQRDAKVGDSELQNFVANMVPTLRRHLSKAQDIQKTVSVKSDTTAPLRTPANR
jgi:putative membrane protein